MLTNNLLEHKKILLVLAISWTLVIAFLCLVSFKKLPSIGVSGADKYVHATFHFIFTLLWGLYISKQREIKMSGILGVVFISLCYGILIEFLQETLTTTRQADILDVLANFTGAFLSLLVFVFIKTRTEAK